MRALPLLGLTLSIVVLAAPAAQGAGFGCSASAGRITVLGQKVEPVTANAGGLGCVGATSSLSGRDVVLPVPLSAGALVAATQVYPAQRSVLASGGAADLGIGTSALPIELPQVPAAVTAAIQGALRSVDLTPVKSAIPVWATNLPTNLPTNLRTDYTVADINLLDPAMDTLAELLALNDANAATNAANLATNTANQAINAANAALNQIRASIPDTVTVDDAAIRSLLSVPSLPTIDLVRVRGAMAYALGSCQGGSPSVSGRSSIAGLKVLGTDVPLDQVLDIVRTLIPRTPIDPASLTISAASLGLDADQIKLITDTAPTQLQSVVSSVNATLRSALAGLPALEIPATLAEIKITPGAQVRDGDSIVQQALALSVSVAGRQILEAVIGEAKTSAAGVACAAPVVDPKTPTGATLECSKRRLVLVDVLERSGGVKLSGVADPALAGRTVAIVFGATGRTVGYAKVARDGTFGTTAPLPPASLRGSNAARYTAALGPERSLDLKLRRRMIIRSMAARGRRVTITGRVVRPLARPVRAITLTRRVSCTEERVVTRFRPRPDGTFRVTVLAPKGLGSAVYRMTTKVLNSSSGRALFETFTLPRAVALAK